MKRNPHVYFLVVGTGPSEQDIRDSFETSGLTDRLIVAGVLQSQELADALAAMDIFAIASKSETQGMVLTEAMAAGLPVVALDASGVREVVKDKKNGRLIFDETVPAFAAALQEMLDLPPAKMEKQVANALLTAKKFSMPVTAKKALSVYKKIAADLETDKTDAELGLERIVAVIKAEWDILASVIHSGDEAISTALFGEKKNEVQE
jgi:1,2-diacylglycerol 3-alpha-glucosyltransferase